ncbi:hypothetical protein HK405_012996, partial [Cladochytrium tenue]
MADLVVTADAPSAAGSDNDANAATAVVHARLQLRALLDRKLRLQVSDGRVFAGVLMCLDRARNLVLA